MLDFIQKNIAEIITVIVALVEIFNALKNGQKEQARKSIFELVTEAEKQIVGTQVGEQRLNWVIDQIKVKYPMLKFVPNAVVVSMVTEAVNFANDWIDNGKIDNSNVIAEQNPVVENTENTEVINNTATITEGPDVTSSESSN
jgi:hypothetical protein